MRDDGDIAMKSACNASINAAPPHSFRNRTRLGSRIRRRCLTAWPGANLKPEVLCYWTAEASTFGSFAASDGAAASVAAFVVADWRTCQKRSTRWALAGDSLE